MRTGEPREESARRYFNAAYSARAVTSGGKSGSGELQMANS